MRKRTVPCTDAPLVKICLQAISSIFVPRPNVVSVINGGIPTNAAAVILAQLAMPGDISQLNICLMSLPLRRCTPSMEDMTMKTRNSKHPLWMNWSKGMICIEPGAQLYEGGNVMIQFLCHTFFLLSITQHPYPFLCPSVEVIDRYLLALGPHVISFFCL